MTEPTPRGRRPGAPDTRAAILTAARESFASAGFAGTTIRAIATAAGVDAALVHHYFGTKDELFLAALELPVDPRAVLAPAVAAGPDGAGERMLRAFLGVWDEPETRLPLLALARSLTEPASQKLVAEGFVPVVVQPVIAALGVDRPQERATLFASQIIGLIMVRYLLRVEPLASMPAEQVVAVLGPTLQRYLTGDLPALSPE
jgi:AcrR family transcriptional regulator